MNKLFMFLVGIIKSLGDLVTEVVSVDEDENTGGN